MTAALITALLMGLTGSLHCVGMCGPIMLFMPFQRFLGIKRLLAVLLYHFSRVSVYAALAILVHSFRSIFHPAVQQYISLTLGALLLIAGVLSFFPGGMLQLRLPWSGFVTRHLGAFISSPGLPSIAASGLLNGLLPCGLVYMALSATLMLPATGHAVAFMYVFGAGTLPSLIGVTLLRTRINTAKGSMVKKFTPVIVFCFGCLFLLRGLNLGIPYLSPKVQVAHNGEIHSCCHKK